MAAVSMALALLGGVIGAGFASGREILRFFAIYGRAAPVAIVCACSLMLMLILRLPALMQAHNAHSLKALCQIRLGRRFGFLCSALLMLLFAVTGGAMLAACAELGALMLPIRHAYGLSMAVSLLIAAQLALCGLAGLTLPGALDFNGRAFKGRLGEDFLIPIAAPDIGPFRRGSPRPADDTHPPARF